MELLVTVTILTILASVAIPSYLEQTRKSRRGEGKLMLVQISAMQEQFRTEQNRYTTDLTELGLAAAGWNTTENDMYQAMVLASTAGCPIATCYQLQAQTISGSPQWGDEWMYELWSDGRKRRRSCPENSCSGSWILDWVK